MQEFIREETNKNTKSLGIYCFHLNLIYVKDLEKTEVPGSMEHEKTGLPPCLQENQDVINLRSKCSQTDRKSTLE